MRRVDCNDRERVLREQDPEWLAGLERHAETCADCARELRAWNEIAAAARAMHRSWDSPQLWPSIERALVSQAAEREMADAAEPARPERSWTPLGKFGNWAHAWRRWQVAGAALAAATALGIIVALSFWGASHLLRPRATPVTAADQRRLLTEQALGDVEKSEAAYEASIQKLSALAAPKIDAPKTPLLESYREKLLLLDAAIADCRAQIAQNRANPELRRALLSMYHEKQTTLEQLMRPE